ncbi:hypothetical protein SUGI_0586050 [Cryptomeria japonica]|uniref:transcription factor RAX2 n=1 Tax=Cryptomeria japonica TaxID=3369 RepID=UPI002414BDF4|nr:transcription factor RAX2 [Cryptomeria japonica]GLJ29710.1 hypothetical protein SUGI_0586050 [Cryptomeria japonica]
MGRAPCCDKANVKRGPWSPEEDAILKHFVEKHGTGGNWIALPQKAGLRRCGKSCRLRWLNYLRPDIKHGGFSEEEDAIICGLYSSIGSRWSVIAAQLPGRTDNDIKNYWNTKLKKKLLGKGVKDDQQTRRLLAKEAAAGMRFNSHNITSEAMSASNTSSPSVSLTDLGQQHRNSPYALEASNVPVLLQGPSSSASSESSMSKTATFNMGNDHYEKDFSHDSEYSNFTSILMRALESNRSTNCSSHINPSQITPSLINPHEAYDAAALYVQRPTVNVKAETFDQNDTQLPYSMPLWESCNPYQSGNMWMHEANNGADTNFSYSVPGNDQMGELLFYSHNNNNNNNSVQIKEEPTNYGVTPTEAFWVSQLAAASASASDPKSSAYSYILPSEGNSNTASQGIFQEGVIY